MKQGISGTGNNTNRLYLFFSKCSDYEYRFVKIQKIYRRILEIFCLLLSVTIIFTSFQDEPPIKWVP